MKRPRNLYLALFLFSAGYLSAQTISYVKRGGTGIGSSWEDASGGLQLMINQAAAYDGGQVWGATGKYFPLRNAARTEIKPLSEDHAFVLQPRVQVFGSFSGTELSLAQRPPRIPDHASQLNGGLSDVDQVSISRPLWNSIIALSLYTANLQAFIYPNDVAGREITVKIDSQNRNLNTRHVL